MYSVLLWKYNIKDNCVTNFPLLCCRLPIAAQTSSDGNQTTSTLSITLNRSDAGRYLSCRAYNHAVPSDALEDGWRLDIQCECLQSNIIPLTKARTWHHIVINAAFSNAGIKYVYCVHMSSALNLIGTRLLCVAVHL